MLRSTLLRAVCPYSTRTQGVFSNKALSFTLPPHLNEAKISIQNSIETEKSEGRETYFKVLDLKNGLLVPKDIVLVTTNLRREGYNISSTYSSDFSEVLLQTPLREKETEKEAVVTHAIVTTLIGGAVGGCFGICFATIMI